MNDERVNIYAKRKFIRFRNEAIRCRRCVVIIIARFDGQPSGFNVTETHSIRFLVFIVAHFNVRLCVVTCDVAIVNANIYHFIMNVVVVVVGLLLVLLLLPTSGWATSIQLPIRSDKIVQFVIHRHAENNGSNSMCSSTTMGNGTHALTHTHTHAIYSECANAETRYNFSSGTNNSLIVIICVLLTIKCVWPYWS